MNTDKAFVRLDAAITLLGLLGLALFLAFYDRAFPSAAIDLDLSRGEIAQRAQSYLRGQGYAPQDYEFALSFEQDWWGSVYLQRTIGIPETNRLIRSQRLPIWRWHARWFRPLQKEEFAIYLSPGGEVLAFAHSVEEDAPGAKLSQDEGRALAEVYLTQDRGWALADWAAVVASSEERPGGRTDHHFEWKRRDFSVGDSELRLAVDVQGKRIGGYDFWLKVPEAFRRHFSEQRNRALFFNNLSYTIGFVGLGAAAFGAYLIAVWRGILRWYAGLGPALAVAAVGVLAGLNDLPLHKAWYPTTEDYTLFWLERLFNLLFSAGYSAVLVLVLWAGGQRLSKRVWPRRDKVLPRGEHRWGVLARSGWRGLMLGGLMAGYLVLFYLAATRLLGGWTPLDMPRTSLFATPLPFLAPLEVGLLPAMNEELMFRLVGVSLVLWLTDRRSLALLVPGALWGFAHLSYVRDPFFLRGIELTISAVFLMGWFFLRFDLVTAIVAHFTYNAGLTALPLLRSEEPYFVVSGLLVVGVMLAPVVPGAVGGLRRRLRGEKQKEPQPKVAAATASDLAGLSALPLEGLDWPTLLYDAKAVVLCLRTGAEVIGVAAGRVAAEGTAEVLAIYVAPPWRRQYWGSALVDALCTRLQERGAQSVQTAVETVNQITAAFWASQGWRSAVTVFRRSFMLSRRRGWREVLARDRSPSPRQPVRPQTADQPGNDRSPKPPVE